MFLSIHEPDDLVGVPFERVEVHLLRDIKPQRLTTVGAFAAILEIIVFDGFRTLSDELDIDLIMGGISRRARIGKEGRDDTRDANLRSEQPLGAGDRSGTTNH